MLIIEILIFDVNSTWIFQLLFILHRQNAEKALKNQCRIDIEILNVPAGEDLSDTHSDWIENYSLLTNHQ